jgi:hypothetical protein
VPPDQGTRTPNWKVNPLALAVTPLISILSFPITRNFTILKRQICATMIHFYMTTRTTLSDDEKALRGTHSCSARATRGPCALAAASIQGRSNTVPSRDTEFLIANLELEFELNHRKQSSLRISNRKYFAIFSLNPPPFPGSTPTQSSDPNRNSHTIRILTNSRNITTYAFSNRNKIDLFAICLPPRFSPPKGTSRDMILALPPLQ